MYKKLLKEQKKYEDKILHLEETGKIFLNKGIVKYQQYKDVLDNINNILQKCEDCCLYFEVCNLYKNKNVICNCRKNILL